MKVKLMVSDEKKFFVVIGQKTFAAYNFRKVNWDGSEVEKYYLKGDRPFSGGHFYKDLECFLAEAQTITIKYTGYNSVGAYEGEAYYYLEEWSGLTGKPTDTDTRPQYLREPSIRFMPYYEGKSALLPKWMTEKIKNEKGEVFVSKDLEQFFAPSTGVLHSSKREMAVKNHQTRGWIKATIVENVEVLSLVEVG